MHLAFPAGSSAAEHRCWCRTPVVRSVPGIESTAATSPGRKWAMTTFDPSVSDEDDSGQGRFDGIDAKQFEREFGEPLGEVLDLKTWSSGPDFPGDPRAGPPGASGQQPA